MQNTFYRNDFPQIQIQPRKRKYAKSKQFANIFDTNYYAGENNTYTQSMCHTITLLLVSLYQPCVVIIFQYCFFFSVYMCTLIESQEAKNDNEYSTGFPLRDARFSKFKNIPVLLSEDKVRG